MTPRFSMIEAKRDVEASAERAFDHWLDPDARKRWETPPESGMRYQNFDPREGGFERIDVLHAGGIVGELQQRFVAVRRPELVVLQVTGIFDRRATLAMQVTVRFVQHEAGCLVVATSQVCELTGRDVTQDHKEGWAALFAAFAKDLRAQKVTE